MKTKKKKYRVTVEYHSRASTEVEADNEDEAERIGIEECDEMMCANATVYDLTVREI